MAWTPGGFRHGVVDPTPDQDLRIRDQKGGCNKISSRRDISRYLYLLTDEMRTGLDRRSGALCRDLCTEITEHEFGMVPGKRASVTLVGPSA